MKKSSIIRSIVGVLALLVLAGAGVGMYLWYLPHRNVAEATVDFELTASQLVEEYLRDGAAADAKYLDAEGESRILVVSGPIHSLRKNQRGATVVVLREPGSKAGVACTLQSEVTGTAPPLSPGQSIQLKGVIRAGAQFSDVLETYTDAVIEECVLL